MRVLLLTQHYYPETVATSRRAQELAQDIAAAGHRVTVVAAQPNHPASLARGLGREPAYEELSPGLQVVRVPVFTPADGSFSRRLLTYGSFVLSTTFTAVALRARPDVVVAISPLPAGLAAAVSAAALGAPLVFDLQDIWPESAAVAGAVHRGAAYTGLEGLERWLYRRCAAVTVITRGFRRRLIARGVPPERVRYVPNGVDVEFFRRSRPNRSLLQRYGLGDHFTVMFLGNMGLMQDLDTVLDTARLLASERDIRFLLVGEGVRRDHLAARVAREGLDNVTLIPGQPRELVPDFLHLADAAIVSLLDRPLFSITVPSKTYECMAAARPILCGVKGETREIVTAAGCGVPYEPEDALSLAAAVREMRQANRRALGTRGRRWVKANATRQMVAAQYLSLLEEVRR